VDCTINKVISRQPIVYFLGAGSSVPLGMPTTTSFRQVLLRRSNAEEKRIIKALYSSAGYRYGLPEEAINLERFLEFLHELRLGLWLLSKSNLSTSISPALGQVPFDSWAEADLNVNLVKWKVLETLHEVCGDCSGQKVRELWEPLFKELQSVTSVFPIFSLNYDWAFEKLCLTVESDFRLSDGFSSLLGGQWSPKHYLDFKPSKKRIDICLFKLHGSTCWVGGIKSLGSFSGREAKPKHGFESGDMRPFEIVYPGFRREVWLGEEHWSMPGLEGDISIGWRQREPFSLLYTYLDECLMNCKVLVVIGYAFGDNEINTRLANALAENRQPHKVVLDPGRRWQRKLPNGMNEVWFEAPYNWSFRDAVEPEAWNNRLHWIHGKFGTKRSQNELLRKVQFTLS